MKVKAKSTFKNLTITNSYQGLNTKIFFALQRGETVELNKIPEICKEHLEEIKNKKKKPKKRKYHGSRR